MRRGAAGRTRRWAAALTALGLLALPSCAGEVDDDTLTVQAAASLSEAFTEIGERFAAEHGVEVVFNFAGSADLVAQVQQGAPADVLATADVATMDRAVADDLVADAPEVFATNVLTIVTEPGNPTGITGLADLAADGRVVVVCAPAVPCGRATAAVTQRAGVQLSPASEEQSVTDVLNKVRSGEADAGLVYVTDARRAGDDVAVVELPEAAEAVNLYPIAALAGSDRADLADTFVDFVLGEPGRAVLESAGFGAP